MDTFLIVKLSVRRFDVLRLQIIFLSLCVSCTNFQHHDSKTVLRLVNKPNDGWNAFNIIMHEDSSYEVRNIFVRSSGHYSISGNVILLHNATTDEKIKFNMTDLNCPYNIQYISKSDTTDMRVILDSIFCHRISREELMGSWEYKDNKTGATGDLQFDDSTAKKEGVTYREWRINDAELQLIKNNTEECFLILNFKKNSFSFKSCWQPKTDSNILKAIRLH